MKRKKTTKNIGNLAGKILLFGGVYSNLQSLQKIMEIAKNKNITSHNIICTGDVVAYCAQPEEVVQTVKDWNIHSIAGNVEIQLREGLEDCGCDFRDGSRCDIFSKEWYPYAQEKLSASSIEWMDNLPDFIEFDFAGKKCGVVHGSYFETSGYIFQSTDWEKKSKNFEVAHADIIIGGHCGLPFSQKNQDKLWLNPGVIGMPANDGTTRVWYMILDLDHQEEIFYTHLPYQYDHIKAANLMAENKLTPAYEKTLRTGIWDNCEILPEQETRLQGQLIVF